MQLILKIEWDALDASDPQKPPVHVKIPAGTHEVERIPNPSYDNGTFWLVLKGTKIGASEGSWRQWVHDGEIITNPRSPNFGKPINWGDWEVVIVE